MEKITQFTLKSYRDFIDSNSLQEILFALAQSINEIFIDGVTALNVSFKDSGTVIQSDSFEKLPIVEEFTGNSNLYGMIASTATLPKEVIDIVVELINRKQTVVDYSVKKSVDTTVRILGITYHDVRNTLGSISGIAQLMEMDAEGNNELLESIKDIVAIVDTFDQTSVTTMKLLRDQPITYEKRSFPLSDNCETHLKRSSRVFQLSGIELHSSVAPDITCFGDEERIMDIFQELLTNSATALESSDGGIITVSVEQITHNIVMKVSHNGSPINSDVQEYIFTPFFTTKTKGRGMGLTRMQRYLNDWGGSIEVTSNPNELVSFIVTFPATLQ